MTSFVNSGLCLLRTLFNMKSVDNDLLKKCKQRLYEQLFYFLNVEMCSNDLFRFPDYIRESKDFDQLFRALDNYYAENFAYEKKVEVAIFFDRMLMLLIKKFASEHIVQLGGQKSSSSIIVSFRRTQMGIVNVIDWEIKNYPDSNLFQSIKKDPNLLEFGFDSICFDRSDPGNNKIQFKGELKCQFLTPQFKDNLQSIFYYWLTSREDSKKLNRDDIVIEYDDKVGELVRVLQSFTTFKLRKPTKFIFNEKAKAPETPEAEVPKEPEAPKVVKDNEDNRKMIKIHFGSLNGIIEKSKNVDILKIFDIVQLSLFPKFTANIYTHKQVRKIFIQFSDAENALDDQMLNRLRGTLFSVICYMNEVGSAAYVNDIGFEKIDYKNFDC